MTANTCQGVIAIPLAICNAIKVKRFFLFFCCIFFILSTLLLASTNFSNIVDTAYAREPNGFQCGSNDQCISNDCRPDPTSITGRSCQGSAPVVGPQAPQSPVLATPTPRPQQPQAPPPNQAQAPAGQQEGEECKPTGVIACAPGLRCDGFVAGIGGIDKHGKCVKGTSAQPPPPPPPCAEGQFVDGRCNALDTGFGNFKTDPGQFIKSFFGVILAFAGGIALLLIMRSGYGIMTSKGNPEKINEARDQLISAIVGLLFLIFSFVILQVIGVDILRIPGSGGQLEGNSCDVAGSNQCPTGQSCISSGIGGRSGTCRRNVGSSCDLAGNNQCPNGQTCTDSGIGGRYGTCQ